MLFLSSLLSLFVFLVPSVISVLDDDIHYEIKWQKELIPTIPMDNQFIFTSKRKEIYTCAFPTPQKISTSSVNTVHSTDIEPLIESLHSRKFCIYRYDSYWIYEFCPGLHIRQYHETSVASKKTVVQEYYLGYYQRENQQTSSDANNELVYKIHSKRINHRDVPMFAHQYTDGTPCDINNDKPREIAVFYVCDEKGTDGILHFQEISTCQYELIVAAPWICKLPEFSLTSSNQYEINCFPREHSSFKPRNLIKLENEPKTVVNKDEGPQLTMIDANGATVIISYEYVKPEETNAIKYEMSTKPPETLKNDRQFLENFFSGQQCLIGGTGWWKFEICYGKSIIQFHDGPNGRTSIQLGKWNLEKHVQWSKNKLRRRLITNRKNQQYVSLFYSDGDLCSITQSPRTVEVKLRCSKKIDPNQAMSMYLVEPESCSYILGIESPLFCDLLESVDEFGVPNIDKLTKSIP